MIFGGQNNYSSLFARYSTVFLVTAIGIIVLIAAILLPRTINGLAKQHRTKVMEYLASDVQYALLVGDSEAVKDYVGNLHELPWIDSVSIATPGFNENHMFGHTAVANSPEIYGKDIKHWNESGQAHTSKIVMIGGEDGPKTIGGYIHIAINEKVINTAVIWIMGVMAASIIIGAVVMIPAYISLSRKITRPIVRLSELINETKSTAKGYGRISMERPPDEVENVVKVVNQAADLADDYNDKLAREVENRTSELNTALNKLKKSENTRFSMMLNSSHDLGSPLTALIGFIDVAREQNERKETKGTADSLDIAYKAALGIKEQIQTLLEYSADASDEIIRQDIVNIDGLVHNVLHQLEATHKQSKNSSTYDHLGPHKLVLDRHKVERVLHCLISNAFNYCTEGEVTIKTLYSDMLTITVEDTGIGMDSERLETIFLKNYKGGESSHSGHRGVGIGLSMCKGWVEMMDGDITVDTIPGEMTKFTVEIPASVAS